VPPFIRSCRSYARRLALILFVAAFATLGAAVTGQAAGDDTIKIISKSGAHTFSVELATNELERAKGLMFRKELPSGYGMLFDFHTEQQTSFWMRNTYIPLDMIFIKADGHILRIAENAKPQSDDLIPSGGPVRAVLEVIAGTARKLGIAPGDTVTGSIFAKPH
jgi:uncharacterized membrane protein (UPF0127 family)